MHILAQDDGGYGSAIFWSAVIIGLCIAMFFLVNIVRKKVREDADAGPSAGFTLADLRDLHRAGKMTDEEFEKAKATLIDALKKAASKPAVPPGGRTDPADVPLDRYDP